MDIFLSILIGYAVGSAGVYFTTKTISTVKDMRTKSRQSAAEARMMDEIGRKLAGGDATVIAPNGACDSPYCPVHGKDHN